MNNIYLKALHNEKGILISNIVAVFGSVICTFISGYVLKSLELAVITILIAVAIRNYSAEIIVKREIGIGSFKNIIWEVWMMVVFIITNWYISGNKGFFIYVLVLRGYFVMELKNIKHVFKELKEGI